MALRKTWHLAFVSGLVLAQAPAAYALDLTLPAQAEMTAAHSADTARYSLPIGPFENGVLQVAALDAPLTRTAYRVAMKGKGVTQTLMDPLKAQISAAGFDTVFECQTTQCGGFDFRFGLDLLPEPDMHVDLGDFRYVLAKRGPDETIALVVSRSPKYGFVYVAQIGAGLSAPAKMTEATKSPEQQQ